MYFNPVAIKIIGVGGIGSNLLSPLLRWNQYAMKLPVYLVDGDKAETKNCARQEFLLSDSGENKAKALEKRFSPNFDFVLKAVPEYLTPSNINTIIQSGDIVLVGVDNYKTRVLIQEKALRLEDSFCIFMGNEYTDGDAIVFLKALGKQLTEPIWKEHPEILANTDKLPNEMSCQELMENSTPQIIFTNLTAATCGLNMLYCFMEEKLTKSEVYFDIKTLNQRSTDYAIKKPEVGNEEKQMDEPES